MNKIELIKLMIDYVDEYRPNGRPEDKLNLDDFRKWLVVKFVEEKFESNERDVDSKNFELLAIIQQYSGKYIREGLKDTGIRTIWDFIFLAILHHQGDKGMVDLINISRMEKSSGMEVVKRLHKSGFVRSIDDKNDKRKKLQQITQEGKKQLIDLYPIVSDLSIKIGGNLTVKEKGMLFHLLDKLNSYHEFKLGYNDS